MPDWLYFDGFDNGDWLIRGYSTPSGGNASTGTSTTTRLGEGRSLLCSANRMVQKDFPSAETEFYMGVALSVSQTITVPLIRFYGDSGATIHGAVGWAVGGSLNVYRGTTSIASAVVSQPVLSTWAYIETYFKLDDTVGRFQVRVDGATVIDFTGDTKNAGTGTTISQAAVGLFGGVGGNVYVDDWYLNNTGFLGPVRVRTLAPTGAGTQTQMTPSTGANWSCVDEQPYSASDYVTGSTGQRDTYALGDLPSSPGTIYGVQGVAIGKKTDAGALSVRNAIRSGGTVYTGSSAALATTDSSTVTTWSTDPNTASAWSKAGVDALEAGAEVV